jgi:hypothetical protein
VVKISLSPIKNDIKYKTKPNEENYRRLFSPELRFTCVSRHNRPQAVSGAGAT